MGSETVRMEVYATLSRHNSEQDRKDDEAWEIFVSLVKQLATDPLYDNIRIDVYG